MFHSRPSKIIVYSKLFTSTFANHNFLPSYQPEQLAVLERVVTEATGRSVRQQHFIFLPQQLQIPQHHNESTYSVGEHITVTAVAYDTQRNLEKTY